MNIDPKFDHKKFAILYVDDETQSLSLFQQAFGDDFRIFTAPNAREGLNILKKHADEIGLLMTDQQMPGERGTWLLENARLYRPQVVRILVTAYTDMAAAIQAVNTGAIYKYVSKPWDPLDLDQTLRRGLEFYILQRERTQFLREKQSLMRERMLASRVVSLGLVSAGLNHHIKNRLQSITTFLQLIEQGLNDPDLLKNSTLSANEILALLDDLQVASADTSSNVLEQEVAVSGVLAEILSKLQPSFSRLTIQNLVAKHELPSIHADKSRLERLIELLVRYEHSVLPAGSIVKFNVEPTSLNDKPGVAISISDNGPTKGQDALKLAMDPLITRGKPEEYDIYLMVCLFIVRQLGGIIETGIIPDGGNQFVIRLPVHREPGPSEIEETQFLQKVLLNEQLWDKYNST